MASKEFPAFQPGLSPAEKSHAEIFLKVPGQVSAAEAVAAKAVTLRSLSILKGLAGELHKLKALGEVFKFGTMAWRSFRAEGAPDLRAL